MRRFWLAGAVVCCVALVARADDTTPAPAPPANTPPSTTASQIGRSILVVNDVDGQTGDAPAQRIAVNDDIVFEEDITTGVEAKAIVEFRDGSTFELGPNAAVRIDSFVFNPEESTSHKAVEVTRGVFRYVSGYVASNQETQIATPHGQMGIRGSVAEGVVDPAVPDFVFLGQGNATFTNDGGSTTLQSGDAVAIPSAATPPMAPAAMPPAVAAETLQAIENRLPPREALRQRPVADQSWLKRAGAANRVPAAEQRQYAAAAAAARPLPHPAGPGSIAGELGLLAEGNRLNLFTGRQTTRTPEQSAFVTRVAREHPTAGAAMRGFTAGALAIHAAATTVGTTLVMRSVALAAPSREVMRNVTAATLRANRGVAGVVQQHVSEFERRVGEAAHPRGAAPAHPEQRERRQAAPQERRAAPPKPAPKPLGKQPPKKKNEDDRNQH